jgi:6-pyruvoyltetrahydropterin/6-carboxytetrahydropterin synthase
MEIFKSFAFEAAHCLPYVPADHKCARMHGHSYAVEVWLDGPVDDQAGWVADFADIAAAFEPVHDELNHHCLNEVGGLENPTCENLARWIFERLQGDLPDLDRVLVRETASCGALYRRHRPAQ